MDAKSNLNRYSQASSIYSDTNFSRLSQQKSSIRNYPPPSKSQVRSSQNDPELSIKSSSQTRSNIRSNKSSIQADDNISVVSHKTKNSGSTFSEIKSKISRGVYHPRPAGI